MSGATPPDGSDSSDSYVTSFGAMLSAAVGYVLTGNVVGKILGFVGNVLTARIIGTAGFGLLGIVRSTVSLGSTFTDVGVGGTASRYIPRWRGSEEREMSQLLGLVCIVGIAGIVVAGGGLFWLRRVLAQEVYATPGLVPLFAASVPWMAASVVSTMARKVLRGFEKFETLAAISAVRGALTVGLLAPILLLWRGSALGAVLGFGAVEASVALLLFGAAWKEGVGRRSAGLHWPTVNVVREPLRAFALPSYAFLLLQTPVSWFLLTRLARLDKGTEFVGAVQATGSFRGALALLPAALATTLLPVLSRLHSVANSDAFSQRVRRLVQMLWFFAVPAGALSAGALPFLLETVFGEGFGIYAAPCSVLLLITAWSIVNEAFDRTLAAVGRMWLSFGLGAGYAVVAVGLTLVLVPRFALWGYVVAQFVAMAAYVIVQQEIVGGWIQYQGQSRWKAVGLALTGGGVAVTVSVFATGWKAPLVALALSLVLGALGWRLLLGEAERRFVRTKFCSTMQWIWKGATE